MVEYLPESERGRPIDLRLPKTVGQRGRHAPISNKARTVVRVNQTRMMQGWAKKESTQVTKEAVYVGVDVAKGTLYVAVSNAQKHTSLPMTMKVSHRQYSTSPVYSQ